MQSKRWPKMEACPTREPWNKCNRYGKNRTQGFAKWHKVYETWTSQRGNTKETKSQSNVCAKKRCLIDPILYHVYTYIWLLQAIWIFFWLLRVTTHCVLHMSEANIEWTPRNSATPSPESHHKMLNRQHQRYSAYMVGVSRFWFQWINEKNSAAKISSTCDTRLSTGSWIYRMLLALCYNQDLHFIKPTKRTARQMIEQSNK